MNHEKNKKNKEKLAIPSNLQCFKRKKLSKMNSFSSFNIILSIILLYFSSFFQESAKPNFKHRNFITRFDYITNYITRWEYWMKRQQ